MAKNKVFKRLSGSGVFTVPAGVTVLTLYPVFNGLIKGIYGNLARTFDGKGYAWGVNGLGQIGDGTLTHKSTPTAIAGGHTFVQLRTSGILGACGLDIEGRAWVWGFNSNGQIGDGTTIAKSTPTQVLGGHRFIEIEFSGASVYALKQNGEVWSWGFNSLGQLGDGTTGSKSTPVQVVGGHSFVQITCQDSGGYALKENGEVWSWGLGANGRLGIGFTNENRSTPVQVVGGHSFVQISGFPGGCYALKENGEVWAWGRGFDGELGNGDTGDQSTPVQVVGGHSFVKIQGNKYSSTGLALKSNGEVWSWGLNNVGQLGDGSTSSKSTPVQVVGGHSFVDIATGQGPSDLTDGSCSFAMKENGEVWAWGLNTDGQLALGDTTHRSTPTLITSGPRFSPLQPILPLTSLLVRPGQQISYDLPSYFGSIPLSLGGLILEYEA